MASTNRLGVRTWTTGVSVLLSLALWATLSLSGWVASALADDKTVTDALKTIEGTWKTDAEGIDATWTFTGEKLMANVNGQDYACKVKIDPAAKPHSTIDLTIEEGPEDSKGKDSKAIYKFDGEKLVLCVSMPGKDRPKEFAQVEDEAYLFVLKKA